MNSVFLSRPPQSVRYARTAREAKAARKKKQSAMEIITTDPWSTDLRKSSSQVHWNKTGVTNMGFNDSDDEDFPSPVSPSYSSCYDVTPTMTSPTVDNTPGLYHAAVSRRKSLASAVAEEITSAMNSRAPTNERMPLVHDEREMTPRTNYGSHDDRSDDGLFTGHPDFDAEGEGSISFLTSSGGDVINFQAKKSRSSSVMETTAIRSFVTKPRSFSQPLLKSLSSRNYTTLESVSEEDASIDTRRQGKNSKHGKRYDPSTPLIGGTAELLTIYPGYQNQSGISLNEWQVKLGEKEPEQCRCDSKAPAPAPPPKREETPPPPPAPSTDYSSIEYVVGCQVSIGDSVPMTASNAPSEVEGIETAFGTSREMSEIVETPLSASSSASYSATATGDTALSMDMPPPSAGRRRKSIKALFRLGFLSTKAKRKGKIDDPLPSPDAGPPPPPAGSRLTQRRVSRLEMNEPIEDIFSEVKFETMQKRTSTSTAEAANGGDDVTDDDEDDIIEDPEVVLRSIMDRSAIDDENDNLFYNNDVTKPVAHGGNDVIEQVSPEKQLLLPDADRNKSMLSTLSEEGGKTSEDDLR